MVNEERDHTILVTKGGDVHLLREKDGKECLVVTKPQLRRVIASILANSRAAGVPEDGVAEILAQWAVSHLKGGTMVMSEEELRAAGVEVGP
jgi:hypothetical protein